MSTRVRLYLHGLVLVLGLALMVGGLLTTKHGAVVIGIIVAGVSARGLFKANKGTKDA